MFQKFELTYPLCQEVTIFIWNILSNLRYFIRQRQIYNTEEIVSFDVESLFTTVPNNKTIDIIIKDLYSDNKLKTVTKITRNKHAKLLKICAQEAHFMCNSELFEQIDGIVMG